MNIIIIVTLAEWYGFFLLMTKSGFLCKLPFVGARIWIIHFILSHQSVVCLYVLLTCNYNYYLASCNVICVTTLVMHYDWDIMKTCLLLLYGSNFPLELMLSNWKTVAGIMIMGPRDEYWITQVTAILVLYRFIELKSMLLNLLIIWSSWMFMY